MAATSDATAVYKKGSLAALRAERAQKKQEFEAKKNNILMPSISNSIPHSENNSSVPPSINTTTQSIESECKHDGHHSSDSNSGYVDEYGFFVSEEDKALKMAEIGSDEHRQLIRKLNERTQKWLHMLDDWDTYTTSKKAKLKSRIRKGIPTPLRAKVWKQIIGVEDLSKQERAYFNRVKHIDPNEKFKSAIDNDLDRTFPRHILFTKDCANGSVTPNSPGSGRGKESLRNVLYAYANHDEEVGYTQGMGFIAALFLMLMTEEDAFWCLVRLLDQNGEYQLRGLYLDGLPLLHCRYYQFNELLLQFMPKVYQHLHSESLQITPALYASKWFITIFCYEFPFAFVYRIWDIYLAEGIKFVFRVSLALIKMNEQQILRITEFDQMMKYMQHIHQKGHNVSIEELLRQAFDLPLKHDHLEAIEFKYNQERLAEQRRKGRGRNKARDVSEMEPPAFLIKKLSKEKKAKEEEEKEQKEAQAQEGSHSASSYVEEEPSSVLPSQPSDKDHPHDIIPPNNNDSEQTM
eukprot:147906_1